MKFIALIKLGNLFRSNLFIDNKTDSIIHPGYTHTHILFGIIYQGFSTFCEQSYY